MKNLYSFFNKVTVLTFYMTCLFCFLLVISCGDSLPDSESLSSNSPETVRTEIGDISEEDYMWKTPTPQYVDFVEKLNFQKYVGANIVDDNSLRRKLVHQVRDFYLDLLGEEVVNAGDFDKFFTVMDLNNDGRMDLIYEGWSGGEPMVVHIILSNENDTFDEPKEFFQLLVQLRVENNLLQQIIVRNPGCCAEFIQHLYFYSFDNHQFRLKRDIAYIYNIPPDVKIEQWFNISVDTDEYRLRLTPEIDDDSMYVYESGIRGNTCAIFQKGAKGRILGVSKHDPEREWWLVEMFPSELPLKNDMFRSHHSDNMSRLGWMSHKYLKVEVD